MVWACSTDDGDEKLKFYSENLKGKIPISKALEVGGRIILKSIFKFLSEGVERVEYSGGLYMLMYLRVP
jgi:hypothetical protein